MDRLDQLMEEIFGNNVKMQNNFNESSSCSSQEELLNAENINKIYSYTKSLPSKYRLFKMKSGIFKIVDENENEIAEHVNIYQAKIKFINLVMRVDK